VHEVVGDSHPFHGRAEGLRPQDVAGDRVHPADPVAALEAERDRLTAEIRRLETDPRAVEKAAREKLGLAAPGEKVVVDPAPPVKK